MKTYKQLTEEVSREDINDYQLLREGIIAEMDATSEYEDMASTATDKRVKELFLDIAKEEKVHAQEFRNLLETMDLEYKEAETTAKKEDNDKNLS